MSAASTLTTNLILTNQNDQAPQNPPDINLIIGPLVTHCSLVIAYSFLQASAVPQSVIPGTSLLSFLYVRHAGISDGVVCVITGEIGPNRMILSPGGVFLFANQTTTKLFIDTISFATILTIEGTTQPVEVILGVI